MHTNVAMKFGILVGRVSLKLVATPRLHLPFSRTFKRGKVSIRESAKNRDEKCTSTFRNKRQRNLKEAVGGLWSNTLPDTLQNILLILCYAGEIHRDIDLIIEFKINDAVSFVHAHFSQISFSNFNFTTNVEFILTCIHFALGLLTFLNASEALKRYRAGSV